MNIDKLVENLLKISLWVATLCAFYIFVDLLLHRHEKNSGDNKGIFNTWQFPMLLAILADVYILY
jgi:hypothetical protein